MSDDTFLSRALIPSITDEINDLLQVLQLSSNRIPLSRHILNHSHHAAIRIRLILRECMRIVECLCDLCDACLACDQAAGRTGMEVPLSEIHHLTSLQLIE